MTHYLTRTTAILLALTTAWSAEIGVWAAGPATADGQPKFSAGRAELDNSAPVRLKPFTLGVSQLSVHSGAEGDSLKGNANQGEDPALKADTNFQLDPYNKPLTGKVDDGRFNLQASEVVRLLSRYDVQLIVDRSNSMGRRDCPGNLSRWRWCGDQAAGLAQTIKPLVPNGLTIVPFASEYDVFEHASPDNIADLFDYLDLQSGTRLFEPLAEQFDTYFADKRPGKKPLLVVVITDGLPVPRSQPELVRRELIATANRSRPNEVTVIFCQIGANDDEGAAYLQDLDLNLTHSGAKYDIVQTINFDALQSLGLGPALALSLQKYEPSHAAAAPPVPTAAVRAHRVQRGTAG